MYLDPYLVVHLSYISYRRHQMLLLIYVATSSTLHVKVPLLAIRCCLFLAPFALLIFLFNSAILTSMHLGLDQGCSFKWDSTDWILRNSHRFETSFRLFQYCGYLIDFSFHGPYLLPLETRVG